MNKMASSVMPFHCGHCNLSLTSEDFPSFAMTSECNHDPICFMCFHNQSRHKFDDEEEEDDDDEDEEDDHDNGAPIACPMCKKAVHPLLAAAADIYARYRAAGGLQTGLDIGVAAHAQSDDNILFPDTYDLYVSTLDGRRSMCSVTSLWKLQDLLEWCRKKFGFRPQQQRLYLGDREFSGKDAETCTKLLGADLGVGPDAELNLVFVLLEVGTDGGDIRTVVFDLKWGYPAAGRDYLDGSCLIFAGHDFRIPIDFNMQVIPDEAGLDYISHSGDIMDDSKRLGHHKIQVNLQATPRDVTAMFFTLSAYNSSTIASFPTAAVSMFDARRPEDQLCEYAVLKEAGAHQGVVMCALVRVPSARADPTHSPWTVVALGTVSKGNAKDYGPLVQTINGRCMRTCEAAAH
eukprot:ANDGO_08374.mRNA.1 hypothetical protein